MIITSVVLHRFDIALSRQLPVASQRINRRHGLVLTATTQTNQASVEVSPLSGTDIHGEPLQGFSRESLAQCQQQLTQFMATLVGQPIEALNQLSQQTDLPAVAYGLSLLAAKLQQQLPVHHPNWTKVPLLYCNQDEAITDFQTRIAQLDDSINIAKVKVAQADLAQELQLIHQIWAIKPQLKLKLDANQGFTLEQAIEFGSCLDSDKIIYIEEPCQNPADNVTFYQATSMPYALDETLNDPDYRYQYQAGLNALVLKPMIIGDIATLQQLVEQANEDGVSSVLSSSLESSLGINDICTLAAAITPMQAPGVDTLAAFSQEILISNGQRPCLNLDQLTLICRYE